MARKKKKEFEWSQLDEQYFDELGHNKQNLIELLNRYWIPLLEQALNQARRLLEKLEREP